MRVALGRIATVSCSPRPRPITFNRLASCLLFLNSSYRIYKRNNRSTRPKKETKTTPPPPPPPSKKQKQTNKQTQPILKRTNKYVQASKDLKHPPAPNCLVHNYIYYTSEEFFLYHAKKSLAFENTHSRLL